MTDCIFCDIINKQKPANLCYADDSVIAFDDIFPKAPIHKLIVPRQHIATLNEVKPEEAPLLGKLLLVTQQLARQLNVAEDGYRVLLNVNRGGGQMIFHLHFHLLAGKNFSEKQLI